MKSISNVVLSLLTTPITLVTYAFVLTLKRLAPDAKNYVQRGSGMSEGNEMILLPSKQHTSHLVVFFVFLYQRSLLYKYFHRHGSLCCFIPSCTEYAIRAVEKYGMQRGLLITGDRFRRCNPQATGSYVDFP